MHQPTSSVGVTYNTISNRILKYTSENLQSIGYPDNIRQFDIVNILYALNNGYFTVFENSITNAPTNEDNGIIRFYFDMNNALLLLLYVTIDNITINFLGVYRQRYLFVQYSCNFTIQSIFTTTLLVVITSSSSAPCLLLTCWHGSYPAVCVCM